VESERYLAALLDASDEAVLRWFILVVALLGAALLARPVLSRLAQSAHHRRSSPAQAASPCETQSN
jgi:hypothetical protein